MKKFAYTGVPSAFPAIVDYTINNCIAAEESSRRSSIAGASGIVANASMIFNNPFLNHPLFCPT